MTKNQLFEVPTSGYTRNIANLRKHYFSQAQGVDDLSTAFSICKDATLSASESDYNVLYATMWSLAPSTQRGDVMVSEIHHCSHTGK